LSGDDRLGALLAGLRPVLASTRPTDPAEEVQFAEQQRDLYVAAGDAGYWQAALRDASSELYVAMEDAIRTARRVTIDLHYGDHEGGQPTVTCFVPLRVQCLPGRSSVAGTVPGLGSATGPCAPPMGLDG
jgi:hypothetical protein